MQPGSEINTAKKHDRHACALTQERHHSVKFEHFLKAWESFPKHQPDEFPLERNGYRKRVKMVRLCSSSMDVDRLLRAATLNG